MGLSIDMKPANDRVLVKREVQTKTASGIIIKTDEDKMEDQKAKEGLVLATGPGRRKKEGGRYPMIVEEGMTIFFRNFSGQLIEIEEQDEYDIEYWLLKEMDIIAVKEE